VHGDEYRQITLLEQALTMEYPNRHGVSVASSTATRSSIYGGTFPPLQWAQIISSGDVSIDGFIVRHSFRVSVFLLISARLSSGPLSGRDETCADYFRSR